MSSTAPIVIKEDKENRPDWYDTAKGNEQLDDYGTLNSDVTYGDTTYKKGYNVYTGSNLSSGNNPISFQGAGQDGSTMVYSPLMGGSGGSLYGSTTGSSTVSSLDSASTSAIESSKST